MKEKEVLPKGAFFRPYDSHGRDCSDDFIEELSLGNVSRLTCQACNRIHFDGSPTSILGSHRLRELRVKMAQDPDRYLEHVEPFPWVELPKFYPKPARRLKTAFGCPCGFARNYEVSTWDRHWKEEAEHPTASIVWSPDGRIIKATVEVRLPDKHLVTTTFSAKLVSVECFWGNLRYRRFYLTDFSPPYKSLDIVEVGLNPENATGCFCKEYLNKAGWDFAVRVHAKSSHLRLTAGYRGRGVGVWEKDITLPPHGIVGASSDPEGSVQEQILARVRAQQTRKQKPLRVPLSDEDLAIVRRNREFQIAIFEMVEALDSDNVL